MNYFTGNIFLGFQFPLGLLTNGKTYHRKNPKICNIKYTKTIIISKFWFRWIIYFCLRMLVSLVNIKQTDKFCKKNIINIFKCVGNFNSIVIGGYMVGDGVPASIKVEAKLLSQRYSGNRNIQLVSSHFVTQNYPQASLSKLQNLIEGIWLVIITSNLLSYPPFHPIINKNNSLHYPKTKPSMLLLGFVLW